MGSSSKQTTGYKYFSNFLLFIGNPIEKLLGINFDKRGWLHPFVDENGNALSEGIVNSPNLYGENEGGVVGKVHAKYGAANPTALQFYSDYLAVNDLPPLAYPFQSYLAFEDFYLGNSGYMKEMLLWPQRIHVRNDDREQWYDDRAEIPDQNGEEIEQIEARYSDLYNFSTEINGTELQEIDRYAVRRFSFDRNSGSIKLGIGFIYDSIEDQVFSVLIQSTSGPGTYLESDGFKLIRTEILSDDDYWSSRKIYHFRIPKGAPGMRSALFSVSFSGNYTDPMKLSEAYVEINQPQLPVGGMLISSISSLDINPVHKIREILTDDTAMNKPESDVNDLNFMKAADRIYDECLGISWAITEKSCLDAINE
ncbi:hypothetical protein OKC24_19555, partial [Acinetobacter sp. BIT-DXN8]|nr:hypothetical protein [Acinetobacter entericus]